MFSYKKAIVVSANRSSLLGIASEDWFRTGEITKLIFCHGIVVPVMVSYTKQVATIEELNDTVEGIRQIICNLKSDIDKANDNLSDTKKMLMEVPKVPAITSKKTASQLFKEYQDSIEDEENFEYLNYSSSKELILKDNKVCVPHRSASFFYCSDSHLTEFNVNDIVELTFLDNNRVEKPYRGKCIKFVVNNLIEYEWGGPLKRLALTPISDGWAQKDVLIVDPAYRFECLMIDLFPCNRRPFYGFDKKNVGINKVGEVTQLPKCREGINLKELVTITPESYVIRYGDNDKVYEVGKGPIIWTLKICTSTDVRNATKFLKAKIEDINEQVLRLRSEVEVKESIIDPDIIGKYEKILSEN